ncbi:hypothetical protein K470DRAFT_268620 [Piedraia hortae CBS 480.64]|uniref:Peroxin 20 n=1 Tax=Piedraia hortae CBS 480.64 TaxID=1314780 RepID=A0A6A7C5D4_9PEZI|nr:hypothetical protein K470DRAFT_268620 [Piedraia hortae CBS 480.64]
MGDALCGPSNALQQFKQHSTVDRSLQQDRLVARNVVNQGFRSQVRHDGRLDQEFEAFQAGVELPAQSGQLLPVSQQFQPQSTSWAHDFEHMHISPAAQNQSMATGWANDFGRQMAQPQPQQMQPQPQQRQTLPFHLQSQYRPMGMQHVQHHIPPPTAAPAERFDEAAFEKAFAVAESETETKPEPVVQDQDDELAATARGLLDKVSSNQSDKFRNSQFLNLMQKIADRQVRVEGDQMVENAGRSSSSIGTAPMQESRPSPLGGPHGVADSHRVIPADEQDSDTGRAERMDGQKVVDLLTEDQDAEFMMTTAVQ